MITAYESGESLLSIATARKLGKETVSRFLTEAGVRIRRQGLNEKQVAQAVRSYLAGRTGTEIAAELGVASSTVWRALRDTDVERRSQARRKPADA